MRVVLLAVVLTGCGSGGVPVGGGGPNMPGPASDMATSSSCQSAACLDAGTQRDLTGGTGTPMDMTLTGCGTPGDVGNALGVGKYCNTSLDCVGKSAVLCATIGDPNAHFCTMGCTMGGSSTQCGDNARCACDSQGCGCTPNSC